MESSRMRPTISSESHLIDRGRTNQHAVVVHHHHNFYSSSALKSSHSLLDTLCHASRSPDSVLP
jgi:hypothetical protein